MFKRCHTRDTYCHRWDAINKEIEEEEKAKLENKKMQTSCV
jgi:hypothetical protein